MIIIPEKKEVISNLYLSGMGEEFIAMQLDIEVPDVIKVLKELDVYKSLNILLILKCLFLVQRFPKVSNINSAIMDYGTTE
ncbi:MAG: hypothetical protein WB511_05725 [Nitrososphaeraceae archaeon]